jgi:integral membrane protein (TIGR00529 family)
MLKNRKILLTALFIAALAVFFGLVGKFNLRLFPRVFDKNFWDLLILVILVQAVTQTFKVNHYDEKVLKFVSKLSGDLRYTLVIPPLIFGLLPMPAGAMLTADLTQKAGDTLNVQKKWLFFFNYWFRHVCEFSWPLYGALILSAGIAGIPVKDFLFTTFLYMFLAFIGGILYLFTKVKKIKNGNKENFTFWTFVKGAFETLWPVIILIVLVLIKVEMKLAVLLTLLFLFIIEKTKAKDIVITLKNAILSEITLIVFVVLIFKGVVERTNVLSLFAGFLDKNNVPQIVPVIILPMAMSFLTGITSAGIGSTAPILKGLYTFNPYFPYLAYVSAICGVLISPFHLCFITTKEYYKIGFKEAYSTVIIPVLLVMLVAILNSILI